MIKRKAHDGNMYCMHEGSKDTSGSQTAASCNSGITSQLFQRFS